MIYLINRRLLLLISIFATTSVALAQSDEKYGSVVDFAPTLAGNVGEIRTDHFHTGIDIKAAKGVGSPILAPADGYVSRVGVSPTGYGNVLYLTHPDGQTTVYGHLDGFKKSIASWVYQQQMAAKSFRVDLYPTPTQFPVKRGEVIAYLGNSGSSGGPHLHYEIRDTRGNATNIVSSDLVCPVDKISPNIYRIMLYQADTVMGIARFSLRSHIEIKKNRDGDWVMSDTLMRASRPFYLAYEVIDYKNGSSNTMGIYSLQQKVDNVEQFSFAIDRISFATTRYINTFVQYDANRASRNHILRAYVSANNALSIYRNVVDRGIIAAPTADEQVQIETTVADDAGNTSTVAFCVARDTDSAPSAAIPPAARKVVWNEDVTLRDSAIVVGFPSRSLYDSAVLPFDVDPTGLIVVGDEAIPLQKPIKVQVKQEIAEPLRSKALLMAERGKTVTSASYASGWLSADLRRMGQYRVVYDTIAPKITPTKTVNGELRWRVSDERSGVANYTLTVDGAWALAEWDPKSSTMSYRMRGVSNPAKEHIVVLEVIDYKQNKSSLKTVNKW